MFVSFHGTNLPSPLSQSPTANTRHDTKQTSLRPSPDQQLSRPTTLPANNSPNQQESSHISRLAIIFLFHFISLNHPASHVYHQCHHARSGALQETPRYSAGFPRESIGEIDKIVKDARGRCFPTCRLQLMPTLISSATLQMLHTIDCLPFWAILVACARSTMDVGLITISRSVWEPVGLGGQSRKWPGRLC